MNSNPNDAENPIQPTFLARMLGYGLEYLLLLAVLGFFSLLAWVREIPPQEPGTAYLLTLISAVGISAALWYYMLRVFDKYTPIPAKFYIFLILAGGVMSSYLAGFFNTFFEQHVANTFGMGYDAEFKVLLFVGPNEEFWKIAATVLLTWYSREIREPLDVVVAAGAVGLGFATFENVNYMINHGNQVIVDRTLTSVPMHLMLNAIWGYGLAYVRFHPSLRKNLLTRLLPLFVLSAVVHDFYNIVVVHLGTLLQLIIVWSAFLYVYGVGARGTLYSDSSTCNKCKKELPKNATHCPHCHELARSSILPSCPRCSASHLWTERYCHNCGHDLDAWKLLKRSTVHRLLPRRRRSFRVDRAA